MQIQLHLALISDTTFGRGDGIAGLVDAEVEHDAHGLPYLHGRTLKGLLVEEAANLLYALNNQVAGLDAAARGLFGQPGSTATDRGSLWVGHAQLPRTLRDAVASEVGNNRLQPAEVLESLTTIRRQTAMDASGVPAKGSLGALRVIIRQTPFEAELDLTPDPDAAQRTLLAACVLALRRVGTSRNRGPGRVSAKLRDAGGNDVTADWLEPLKRQLAGIGV